MARGQQARQILESPLWTDAWEKLNNQIRQEWRNSPARDVEGREALWLMTCVADKVRRNIEQVLRTGELAQKQLTEIQDGRS